MMTMSYANNNNNSACFGGMNVMEFELGDIYSAPEIMHNSDILSVAKQITLQSINNNCQKDSNSNECSSTDCSSSSEDEDFEEIQSIISACSAKSIFEAISQNTESEQNQQPMSESVSYSRKYRCLKPSIFNPERENILAQQVKSSELLEIPSLEKRISYLFEKIDENYYKIALLNCARKFDLPEELKKKYSVSSNMKQSNIEYEEDSSDYLSDGEEENISGLSEEELLQDLYSAPEIL